MLKYRKWKNLLAIAFFLIMLLAVSACAETNDENLLFNGDFEILDNDGLPSGWFPDAYRMDPGYSVFSAEEGMEGRETHAASVNNTAVNDARFAQDVSVEPETLYCLSGYIKAEGISGGHGANLSIEGVYAFSEKIYETDGDWKYIEYYGETGPDQYSATVFARVGGYSGESKGHAVFDHLKLTKADSVPDGVIADLWFISNTDDYEDEEGEWEESGNEALARPGWPAATGAAFLFILLILAIVYYSRDGKKYSLSDTEKSIPFRTGPLLFLALAVRIIISYFAEGYSVDVNCFVSWGYTMAHTGPAAFYQTTSFCDYPPLYTYILGLNSWIANLVHANPGWTRVIFRFFPSLCDILGCWILLHIQKNEYTESKYCKLIILLLAFNPVTILNSAAWGQMDSVLCLLLVCVAAYALKGHWVISIAFYVTAVLVKPQALMLGFLGLVFMILAVIRDRAVLKKILIGIFTGIILIAVYILPFGINQKPGWLLQRYFETLSSYPYATVNTANLYYLVGGNWSKIENTAHFAAPVFLGCACVFHGLFLYIRKKEEKYILTDIVAAAAFGAWFFLCAILQLNWIFVGTGAMAYAFVIVISMAVRKKDIHILPYLGSLLFILLYVFGIKMHERYLFPAFLLLMFAWTVHRDRRILYLLLVFSLTVFINETIVLDNSIRLGASLGHLNSDTVWLADLLSVINIFGALYAVYLGYSLCGDCSPKPVRALPGFLPVKSLPERKDSSTYHPDRLLHWTIRDTAILCGITVAFSLLTLTSLGSTKAPQTSWSSSDEEEMIIFDLQDIHEDVRILYFGQVSRNNFSFAQSFDGENWSDEVYAQMDQQQCWKWKYVTQSVEKGNDERVFYNSTENILHFNCRYIRLTSCQVGLVLNEILFRDPEGINIPAIIYSRIGGNPDSALWSDPEHLLDEQDTMENIPGLPGAALEKEAQPSWWNSTYFDEIYHARTGFEFMNGTVPYETSHPPLGKIFISWCISIFGMTPFGWRFAGAIAGILMLPGIYLLAKQLTKKTWAAFLSCILLALDCMHLTQTQIATIDSFPVLFIIFAFFFMLRFFQTDLRSASMKEILIPLALSGFFMGLSIASKWIGIYAGIGLAVLYFWHCIRSIIIHQGTAESSGTDMTKKVFSVSLWCVLFFVVVPLGIYLLSYIPYMAYNTRIRSLWDYLAAVWRSQEGMLNYHSTPGLGMDHPFYSPWWEWPIIGKPMFYATEQYIPRTAPSHHSIFCFGNPVIWYGALAALAYTLFTWVKSRHYQIEGEEQRWHLTAQTYDSHYGFVFVGLLAQYLPWVLVPRGTYIYHYFASIPFLIVIISLSLSYGNVRKQKTGQVIGYIAITLAFIFFIILLPYATGLPASTEWLELGKKILRIWY